MTESVLKEFRHSRDMSYLALINTILCAILGIIFLFGKHFLAVPNLACSVLFGFYFLWSKKTPYVQITTQKIIIHKSPLYSPKIVPWEQVSMMQRDGKNKLRLVLRDKRQIKIYLFGMHKTDRADLVQEIERSLQGAANHAFHSDGNSTAFHYHR